MDPSRPLVRPFGDPLAGADEDVGPAFRTRRSAEVEASCVPAERAARLVRRRVEVRASVHRGRPRVVDARAEGEVEGLPTERTGTTGVEHDLQSVLPDIGTEVARGCVELRDSHGGTEAPVREQL